jgi:hypothetical protein
MWVILVEIRLHVPCTQVVKTMKRNANCATARDIKDNFQDGSVER